LLQVIQRIRIEWAHCDPARIIFNPHYYRWMDQGTHRLLDASGFRFFEAIGEASFRGCPLVSSGMDFRTPAFLGDVLELRSQVSAFGNKSFRVQHEFRRDVEVLATGFEVRVWAECDPDDNTRMIGVPVPDDIKDMLSRDGVHDVTV